MIGSLLLLMIVELLNSAIEAVVDRIGPEHNELAGRAKDMGSAAVMLTLVLQVYFAGRTLNTIRGLTLFQSSGFTGAPYPFWFSQYTRLKSALANIKHWTFLRSLRTITLLVRASPPTFFKDPTIYI